MFDSKVQNILEAARKRFAHYGLAKTTMNDIAADIGMSKASLYYYFTDKEKIFVAVIESDISEFVAMIDQVIDRPSKASFKLKKYITLRNETMARLRNLSNLENPGPAAFFNPLFDELKITYFQKEKALVTRILQAGIDQEEFIRFSVDTYAELFLCTIVGLRTTAVTTPLPVAPDHQKVDDQTTLFLEIFLKSIRNNVAS